MAGGARDCLGSIALPLDQPLTLEQLRVHLGRHADPSIRELTDPSYCFVTETNRELNFHEAAGSLVHKVYPSGAVMLKHTKGEKDGSSQASFTEAWTGTHAGTQGSVTPPVVVSHQDINKPTVLSRRILPSKTWGTTDNAMVTYVGPLGMCQRPECNQPGRVKCIDCGVACYCTTRCLKTDSSRHRQSCYRKCRPP
ncbi:uncharacterized protein ISCGN_000685 [Ixodes scapularis]